MKMLFSLSAVPKRLKHSLPDLPYDYNALEPIISAEIMQVHHGKHHQTYVNNLNVAEEKFAEAKMKGCLQSMISAQNSVSFNGGGHINHSIFWQNLTPLKTAKKAPSGDLAKAINSQFGSFEEFVKVFNSKAAAVQGSGWGWLGYNSQLKRVEISTTANQDLLISRDLIPLLAVDVWEHAYYLQYKNMRGDFLKNIWQIINWDDPSQHGPYAHLQQIALQGSMAVYTKEERDSEKANHLRNKTGIIGNHYVHPNMDEATAQLWKKLSENEEQSIFGLTAASETVQKNFVNHTITTLARTCFNMDDFAAYQAAAHTYLGLIDLGSGIS